jgi:hypothetical protein
MAGSVTCFGQTLLDTIEQEITTRCLEMAVEKVELRLSNMGRDLVALGASASVLTRELGLSAPFWQAQSGA